MTIDEHIAALRESLNARHDEYAKLQQMADMIPPIKREIDHLRRAMEALFPLASPDEQERDHA